MWVLLIILVLILLLLIVRIRFRISGDNDGVRAIMRIVFFKMDIPLDKKEGTPKVKKEKEAPKEKKKGMPMSELKDLIGIALKMFGKALKTIRIDLLKAEVTIASDDAFKTAMLYGTAAAGCGILIPPIENNFNIRKKEITVNADFDAKEMLARFDARVSIAIWQILWLGFTFIWRYIKLKNKKEGKI